MANNPKVFEPLDLAQSEQNNLTAIADAERKRLITRNDFQQGADEYGVTNSQALADGDDMGRGTASSMRYKENINDWGGNGLDTILALKPRTFTYKEEYYKHPERVILGLIAEEVAETCKYLADYENEDGSGQVENVRYAYIVVPLIKAIQEQQKQIETQQEQINSLINR